MLPNLQMMPGCGAGPRHGGWAVRGRDKVSGRRLKRKIATDAAQQRIGTPGLGRAVLGTPWRGHRATNRCGRLAQNIRGFGVDE